MTRFAKIPQDKLDSFFEIRLIHDATNKALTRAKSLGFTESNCQPLIIEKLKTMRTFKEAQQEIINSCVSTNLIKFNNDWYGILNVVNKKTELVVCPFLSVNMDSIFVDLFCEKPKTRDEFSKFIKENMNHEALNEYKNLLIRKQDEILNKFFDCTDHLMKNGTKFLITSHCLKRWDERINLGNGRFDNDKRNVIVKDLIRSFKRSKFVYSSDSIGSNFYLDKAKMIFFAVSDDNIILTLWKNSYGFSDDKINDMTTLMQLEYICKCQKNIQKYANRVQLKNQKQDLEKEELARKIDQVKEDMSKLQRQLQSLEDKSNFISQEIANRNNEFSKKKKDLKHEESLIFKQHEIVVKNEQAD